MTATINFNEKILSRALLILSVVLPILFSLFYTSYSGQMWYIAGKVLGYMAPGIIVLHLFIRKQPEITQSRVIFVFGAVLLCYSSYSVFQAWNEARGAKEAFNNVLGLAEYANKKMKASNAAALNRPIPSTTSEPLMPIKHADSGGKLLSAAEVIKGMQPLMKDFIDKSVNLNSRMNAIHIEKALSPENLISPDGIKQSRQMLNQLKSLIAERGANLSQYFADSESYVKNTNTDESIRKQMLGGFFNEKANSERYYAEIDKLQFGVIDEANAIFNIAEQCLGRLTVSNGQLLFPDQASLDSYNHHLKNILALTKTESRLEQERQKIVKQKMDESNRFVNGL